MQSISGKTMKHINFASPDIIQDDIDAVNEVLRSGWITSGSVGDEFASALKEYLSSDYLYLLNSATAGLFTALKAMGIGRGDEVITSPYTFAATANAVLHTGAEVVFADVKKDSFYMDENEVYRKLSPRTKAVIPVDFCTAHNWNFDNDMLASSFSPSNPAQEQLSRPLILLDSAHALGSRFMDSSIDMAVYSFHAVKNLTTAEGGALAVRGLDLDIKPLILHGQNKNARDKFLTDSWEYDITEPGYKFNMPDILAALGLSQFRRYESVSLPLRRKLTDRYINNLRRESRIIMDEEDIFQKTKLSSCHLMPIRIRDYSEHERNALINYAKSQGVSTNVHFKPLHLMTANKYYKGCNLPHSENQYKNQISLPLHTSMSLSAVGVIPHQAHLGSTCRGNIPRI